jgi:hypothetical protein
VRLSYFAIRSTFASSRLGNPIKTFFVPLLISFLLEFRPATDLVTPAMKHSRAHAQREIIQSNASPSPSV